MVAAPPVPLPRRSRLNPRPCVLLTGFAPFDGETLNPSAMAVTRLQGRQVAGHRIVTGVLPTTFGDAPAVLRALMQRHRPALVVCVGQAGGRSAMSLERIAINVDDARMTDNAGSQPIDTPVVVGGPAAYFSALPIKAMRAALQQAGIAAEVSQTAGTFVCNHVFYRLMHLLATEPAFAGVRGGFIHVPWLAQQGEPSMALDHMVQGLRLALRVALTTRTDIRQAAGQLS